MTLGDMLILEMLGEDCIDGEKLRMMTEKQRLEKLKRDKIVYGHYWYITLNSNLVRKNHDDHYWVAGNIPDGKALQAMCWNDEFYIADVWFVNSGRKNPRAYSEDLDRQMTWLENQGWELIPTKYYNKEVEGT